MTRKDRRALLDARIKQARILEQDRFARQWLRERGLVADSQGRIPREAFEAAMRKEWPDWTPPEQ